MGSDGYGYGYGMVGWDFIGKCIGSYCLLLEQVMGNSLKLIQCIFSF